MRPLKALLVLGCSGAVWLKEHQLPFPPFPGLGIRIDVYDMLNVESVVIGDPGFDVTCICTVEMGWSTTPTASARSGSRGAIILEGSRQVPTRPLSAAVAAWCGLPARRRAGSP